MASIQKIYPFSLEEKGQEVLGIPSGLTGTRVLQTRLSAMKKHLGYLVNGKEIQDWKIRGFVEKDGAILLYGPAFHGKTLHQLIAEKSPVFLNGLLKMAQALKVLKEERDVYIPLQSNSVMIGEQGVLFLPFELTSEVNDYHDFSLRREVKNYIIHPDLDGENSWSYSMACLLYCHLTGNYPIQGDDEVELNNEIRSLDLNHKLLFHPEIKKDVRDFLHGCFQKNEAQPDLSQWIEFLSHNQDQPLVQSVSDDERDQSLREARRQEKQQQQILGTRNFWRKYWQRIAIIAVVVISVGAIVGTSIKNTFFRVRLTKGFTPREVIDTYYQSIDELDYLKLGDCLVDGAGQDMLNYVSNLYVISRQLQAMNQQNTILPAKKWDELGRPQPVNNTSMMGITRLKINMIQDEPEPVFENEYEFWISESAPDERLEDYSIEYTGEHRIERYYLRKDRGDWVIYEIEKIENHLLKN